MNRRKEGRKEEMKQQTIRLFRLLQLNDRNKSHAFFGIWQQLISKQAQ
jgi:hypothetical protein